MSQRDCAWDVAGNDLRDKISWSGYIPQIYGNDLDAQYELPSRPGPTGTLYHNSHMHQVEDRILLDWRKGEIHPGHWPEPHRTMNDGANEASFDAARPRSCFWIGSDNIDMYTVSPTRELCGYVSDKRPSQVMK